MTRTEQREARVGIRESIDECDADMIGLREELRDVRERIATLKALRADLKAKLVEMTQALRKGA
jgi:uncharacterized coiled-coil DUF342 family protein